MTTSFVAKTIHLTGKFTPDQQQELDEIRRMRAVADQREKALLKAIQESPDVNAVKHLFPTHGGTTYGVAASLTDSTYTFAITVTYREMVEQEEPAKKSTYRPHLNLDGKTLNLLLQGKILNEAQKARLVAIALGEAATSILDKPKPEETEKAPQ